MLQRNEIGTNVVFVEIKVMYFTMEFQIQIYGGGCSCEGKKFSSPHDWQKLVDFQNIETDLVKYPNCYFNIQ